MQKFFYVANIRMPTERAHGIQIMEMCRAFSEQGFDVELIVPNRKSEIKDDPFVFYDIPPIFKIKKLWCLDSGRLGRAGFWLQTLTFAESASWYLFLKKGIFYTRDEIIALFLETLGKRVSWEAHMGQKNIFVKLLARLGTKTVVITEALRDLYISLGVSTKKIIVAADGADISRFDINLSKKEARTKLNLPQDKKIILYKGSLGVAKGAGILAEAASLVATPNTQMVFIGGSVQDVETFKFKFADNKNISILGNRPRQETPVYQKAADILVIPNSAKEEASKYTSPMKLFGYMAGGVPIVASDLPSLREVLNEQYAYFFTPDDPKSLAEALDKVLGNYEEAESRARDSLEKVREYSWERRAEKILAFIRA